MGDAQNGSKDPETPAPAPAPKISSKVKKIALLILTIFLAGLVQQGYVPQAVSDTILKVLVSLGLAY